MLVVATELWVGTLEGWVSASLWLLDTVVGSLLALSWTLFLLHGALLLVAGMDRGGLRTRYGEPSWTGCAETSSWILRVSSVCGRQHSFDRRLLTRHCD